MAFSFVSALAFSPPATTQPQASDFTLLVDTFEDSNAPEFQICSTAPVDCSLRGAISLANADPSNHYTVNIPAGTYSLSLPGSNEDDNQSGDLDIKADVALVGIQEGVILMGNQTDRVLHIHLGSSVQIENLQISGGKSPDGVQGSGQPGGGIYNRGSLTLINCTVEGNQAGDGDSATIELQAGSGGSGGGIQNTGDLTLEDSFVSNNTAGAGGAGYVCQLDFPYDFCFDCNSGGTGGSGGGINNAGVLRISNSTLENNQAGLAGSPGMCVIWDAFYTPGQPGAGGGIANLTHVSVEGSILQGNQGGHSGGGLSNRGTAYLAGDSILDNRASLGGGLSNQHNLELETNQLISNTADLGGAIYNNARLQMLSDLLTNSNASLGGGLYNEGNALLAGVLIQDNRTRNGVAGADETPCPKTPCPAGDGGSPHGGGIFNSGQMQLDQGIVSGNATGDGGNGGNGDIYSAGNGGSGGFGGGIYNSGSFTLNFTPVISNTTGDGGLGGTSQSGDGQDGTGGSGGGIYNSGTMTVLGSKATNNQTGSGPAGAGTGGGIANSGSLNYNFGNIAGNQTSPAGNGGGIYTNNSLTLSASTVLNNAAGGYGGGLFAAGGSLYSTNDIFASNSAGAEYAGSGLYLDSTDSSLLHTSLAQNSGGDGSGITVVGTSLQMTNTILVSQTIGISVTAGAQAILEDTLWGEGSWANGSDWAGNGTIITGTNNTWQEPGFIDPASLDYHLSPSSAAIDLGIPTAIGTDLDNQPRPNPSTGIPDLGADEYWSFTPISSLEISGPLTGTTHTAITLTASISPTTATPNILYYWFPSPDNGQWTDTAGYQWNRIGTKTIAVTASQDGRSLRSEFNISLEAGTLRYFLPLVNH